MSLLLLSVDIFRGSLKIEMCKIW